MIKITNLIICSIIAILICNCASANPPTALAENSTDSVYLIFDNPMEQDSFTEMGGNGSIVGSSFLSYIGTDGFPVYFYKPKSNEILALPTHNGYLEIGHQYKGLQTSYFYLKGGDTVTFHYNELKQPVAKSHSSDTLTHYYNFLNLIDGASSLYGFNPKSCLMLRLEDRLKYYNNDYTKYINNYKNALDSAINSNRLDSIYISYYKYRYANEIDSYKFHGDRLNKQKNPTKQFPLNDSLVNLISYYALLYKPSFEDIEKDMVIPPKSRKLATYSILRLLNVPSVIRRTPQELEPYYKKTINITGDSSIILRIHKEFPEFYSDLKEIKTTDLMLKTISGDVVSFESVLKKHNGKVIYADFWASWCSPCVGGMPAGYELRKEYSGKDIVFIYLAKGDKESSWKDAVTKYKIDQHGGQNYFVMNEDAEFIKTLGINAIPRYVLIDKTGKVVNSLAPRPGDQNIKAEIDKYLN